MKNLWLILVLPWLLAGCVLERFELPQDYAPKHPGATAPLADGVVFQGVLDAKKGGEMTLRFVKTAAVHYVMEQFIVMPDGDEPALPPAHVRFLPLGGAHYALYWKRLTEANQGYALVRVDAGRLQVLEPVSPSSTLALAKAHGIAAKPPGLGGYRLDTTDEARVMKFFKGLATRKTEAALTFAATQQPPAALRERTLVKLGEHIPRLTRDVLGGESDAAAVVAWARTLAREGNGHGHYLLARLTANGWGTPADTQTAIREAEKAVGQGVPQAANVTATVYYYGVGVPADPARALPYARRAAEAGSPNAMQLLGLAYGNGRGTAEDRTEAKRWLKRAADLGLGSAHAQWADLVIADNSADGDRAAVPVLEKGIAHGDARAYFLRGFLHEHGRAGPVDMNAAMQHYSAAAERGDAYSKYLVGYRLRHGQHIPQDIPRGRALLAEAAQAGIDDAKKALAEPDPVPAKKGCVEDWCKEALEFADAYLSDLKVKMRRLRAELGKCPEVENANLSCEPLAKAPPASRDADGSMRVVYFFAYGCPKCAGLNAFMRKWSDSRRVFVWRVHALLRDTPRSKNMARTHYALKSLGVVDAMDEAVFNAASTKRLTFSGEQEFVAFAGANGLNTDKAKAAFGSAATDDELDMAAQAGKGYKFAGVPVLFVNGRYQINLKASDAKTLADLGELLDELVAQETLVKR